MAVFALVLVSLQGAPAQTPWVVSQGSGGSMAVSAGIGPPVGTAGEPYSAIRKTTRVEKLADDVTITREATTKEARDASGRVYREMQPEMPVGAPEPRRITTFYSVYDPVAGVVLNWNSNSTEATLTHFPDPALRRQQARALAPDAGNPAATAQARPAMPKPLVEELGTKTINGIEAQGTRTTRTFPAGMEGNDEPFSVTTETWTSPALRTTVLQINDDPRSGVSTMELTEIERGAPDPALFQVPEGYTVRNADPSQSN